MFGNKYSSVDRQEYKMNLPQFLIISIHETLCIAISYMEKYRWVRQTWLKRRLKFDINGNSHFQLVVSYIFATYYERAGLVPASYYDSFDNSEFRKKVKTLNKIKA